MRQQFQPTSSFYAGCSICATIVLVTLYHFFSFKPVADVFRIFYTAILGCLPFLVLYVYLNPVREKKGFDRIAASVTTLAVLTPIYSAWRAQSSFGQPFVYGLLAERHWLAMCFGPLLYLLVKDGKISLNSVKWAMLCAAWTSLILYFLLSSLYLIFPDELSVYMNKSIIINSAHRGLRVKLPNYFIIFGAFYYFNRINTGKPLYHCLVASLFMAYLLLISRGRIEIVFMTVCLCYVFCMGQMWRHWKKLALISAIWIAVILTINSGAEKSENYNLLGQTLSDVASLSEGKPAKDKGLNARAEELNTALYIISERPLNLLLGIGKLSHHWERGFAGNIGYFFPIDIGPLGAILVYGLFFSCALVVASSMGTWTVAGSISARLHPPDTMHILLIYHQLLLLIGHSFFWPLGYSFTFFLAALHKEYPATTR